MIRVDKKPVITTAVYTLEKTTIRVERIFSGTQTAAEAIRGLLEERLREREGRAPFKKEAD